MLDDFNSDEEKHDNLWTIFLAKCGYSGLFHGFFKKLEPVASTS